jgi:hypothetical protein
MNRGGCGAGAAGTAPHAYATDGRDNPSSTPPHHGQKPRKRKSVVCVRHDGGPSFVAKGQQAKALVALAKAGAAGVTAQEVSTWALRLSAYVHVLRRRGLEIEMARESHSGGWHGRYLLHSSVTLEPAGGSDDAR